MLHTWFDTTSEIQHLLTQRRELTRHGAVDPITVRPYLDQLADFARQLAPLREQLQQHLDDLTETIEQYNVQYWGSPST